MNRHSKLLPLICLSLSTQICVAQTPAIEPANNVISGTVAAIGYPLGAAGTKINMMGTSIATKANGDARVDAKTSGTEIELSVDDMPPPTSLGSEFLTYVAWTVTPDGTTTSLGELQVDRNGSGKLEATAQSQTFALIVTAEPYFAVHIPSQAVVLENEASNRTKAKIYPNNSYNLMKTSAYDRVGNPLALTPDLKKTPLDIYEARNAVDIAKSRGAEKYAPTIFEQALSSLQLTESALAKDSGKNQIISAARQTIQLAEDSRALAAQREKAEQIEHEKEAAAAVAASQAKAEADARAATEARQQAQATATREEQMQQLAAAQSAEQKAEADAAAARAAAAASIEQAALQAKADAAKAAAAQAQAATVALRAQLLQQLNAVLQTTETNRGLVVNMADVLFELGKFALSGDAQLKLAKLSGIIQAHPGLNLAIEGYTDTTGTMTRNMQLSQDRADAVRLFLIKQGLTPETISAKGLGPANPIADSSTAVGRKLNRRVEIIVSGQVIGINISK